MNVRTLKNSMTISCDNIQRCVVLIDNIINNKNYKKTINDLANLAKLINNTTQLNKEIENTTTKKLPNFFKLFNNKIIRFNALSKNIENSINIIKESLNNVTEVIYIDSNSIESIYITNDTNSQLTSLQAFKIECLQMMNILQLYNNKLIITKR